MHTRGGQIQARGILREISMKDNQDLAQAWNRDQASSDHRAWRSTALG